MVYCVCHIACYCPFPQLPSQVFHPFASWFAEERGVGGCAVPVRTSSLCGRVSVHWRWHPLRWEANSLSITVPSSTCLMLGLHCVLPLSQEKWNMAVCTVRCSHTHPRQLAGELGQECGRWVTGHMTAGTDWPPTGPTTERAQEGEKAS